MQQRDIAELVAILLKAHEAARPDVADFIRTRAEEALQQHGAGSLRAVQGSAPTAH